MKDILTTFLHDHVYIDVIIVTICFIGIILAMAVDLVTGVQKARERGEARTSTGFKKTCDKARKYFGPFLICVFMDMVSCIVIPFPIFSIIWTIWVLCCEYTSVREKAWEKAEIRKQDKTMQVILENRSDLTKAIADALKMLQEQREGKQDGEL